MLKKDLTGPALLEMDGFRVNQAVAMNGVLACAYETALQARAISSM